MQIKTNDYITTIRAMGAGSFYMIFRHLIQELIPYILYQFSSRMKSSILSESSLAFLGLGDTVSKSWGTIIYYAQNKNSLLTGAWVWWIIPPGACICFVCFALILISYSSEARKDIRNER
jgi:ABC-type dipeptide/oligopeptide/nickel transport system permease subunit